VTPPLQTLFAGCDPAGIVTVAVSGGGDSMALLLLAAAWAQIEGHDLHAVTVDHGLRAEAGAEARFVGEVCAGLGIDHTTLAWRGPKPESGLPQAARMARHERIEAHARAIGSDLVLVAHTADDQAETVFMRAARRAGAGSLGRGLAGMERFSLLPGGTLLARPLLGVARAALRQYLGQHGQSWIEDPTNDDDSYERVRVRRLLAADPQLAGRLTRFGAVMARRRAILSRDAAQLLQDAATATPGPVYDLDARQLDRASRAPALLALQTIVALAGGGVHLAPSLTFDAIFGAAELKKATVGGAVIERRGGQIRVWREARNLPVGEIDPGKTAIWDGRLEIRNSGRSTVQVAAWSGIGALAGDFGGEMTRPPVKPAAALAASPVLATPAGTWMPLARGGSPLRDVSARLVCPAIEHFCPASDFPLLEFLARMREAFLADAPTGQP
jgi:tRNA(Ile)-lysidine synthase